MAAAEAAKTICSRTRNMKIVRLQEERIARNPVNGRTRNAGDVGRKETSEFSVKGSSANNAEKPGTGLIFAYP